MDSVLSSVQTLASNADEAGRKKIIDGLRDLAISLETPWDAMQRIMYLVGLDASNTSIHH
jgi:demethylsterigmatocystin 6-O-methyltransferase